MESKFAKTTPSMSVAAFLWEKIKPNNESSCGADCFILGRYFNVQSWMTNEVLENNAELEKLADDTKPVNWAPTEPSVIHIMLHPLVKQYCRAIWYQGEEIRANRKTTVNSSKAW